MNQTKAAALTDAEAHNREFQVFSLGGEEQTCDVSQVR